MANKLEVLSSVIEENGKAVGIVEIIVDGESMGYMPPSDAYSQAIAYIEAGLLASQNSKIYNELRKLGWEDKWISDFLKKIEVPTKRLGAM